MKTKILWFVLGFIVSWLTWSVISYVRLRPRDYTQSWPELGREVSPGWLKNASGRKLGGFLVYTPPSESQASAMIIPVKPNIWPQIMIEDENCNGKLDSLLIADVQGRYFSISLEDTHGNFDSVSYSNGLKENSVSFFDKNMDGQADTRLGPGTEFAVAINGQWHDLIRENNKLFVKINGTPTQVKEIDGVWEIVRKE